MPTTESSQDATTLGRIGQVDVTLTSSPCRPGVFELFGLERNARREGCLGVLQRFTGVIRPRGLRHEL